MARGRGASPRLEQSRIARRLGVSVDAIKYHVANTLQKIGFARRVWDGVLRNSALYRKASPMDNDLVIGHVGQVGRSVKASPPRVSGMPTLGLEHLYSSR